MDLLVKKVAFLAIDIILMQNLRRGINAEYSIDSDKMF